MHSPITQLIEETKAKNSFEIENKLEIAVDRGFWYRRVLKEFGLDHRHETFGERNAVEGIFSLLKSRIKKFFNRFPFDLAYFILWVIAQLIE